MAAVAATLKILSVDLTLSQCAVKQKNIVQNIIHKLYGYWVSEIWNYKINKLICNLTFGDKILPVKQDRY